MVSLRSMFRHGIVDCCLIGRYSGGKRKRSNRGGFSVPIGPGTLESTDAGTLSRVLSVAEIGLYQC